MTSPTRAVATYCDEHVCVSVCLSARISPEPHVRSLPIFFVCVLPMAVARSSSGTLRKSKGKGKFGGFLPIDKAL